MCRLVVQGIWGSGRVGEEVSVKLLVDYIEQHDVGSGYCTR